MKGWDAIAARARAAADANWFTALVFSVIVLNAAVVGASTYAGFSARHAGALEAINAACLGFFVVELTTRIVAEGRRPLNFFRSGWNVFDFVVVAAGFTPGLGQNSPVLRLVRLARVVRLITILPDLRVLLIAVGRSLPPLASLAVLSVLMVYVWAVVGWMLFGEALPERWGDAGTAMLNLFVMLTLENLIDNLEETSKVYSWSWMFLMSYVLAASFMLINILIGVVINSMEEARAIEHRRERAERRAESEDDDRTIALAEAREQAEAIRERVSALEDALEDLGSDRIPDP